MSGRMASLDEFDRIGSPVDVSQRAMREAEKRHMKTLLDELRDLTGYLFDLTDNGRHDLIIDYQAPGASVPQGTIALPYEQMTAWLDGFKVATYMRSYDWDVAVHHAKATATGGLLTKDEAYRLMGIKPE